LILSLLKLFLSIPLWTLQPEQVVQSGLKFYPDVINGLLAIEESENRLRQSRGAFDARLTGDLDSRTEGFYGGDHYKVQIEKPLPYLNSRLYAGARQSYGEFPPYEGKYDTLSRGENFAGLSISLLRNSLIDLNRFNIQNETQNVELAKLELDNIKIMIQTLALKAYWQWIVKGNQLKVYKEILDLALTRASQIEKRIKVGDLAQIYKTENLQYIKKREAQVKETELEFKKAAFYLSLFYRDSSGKVIPLENKKLTDLNELSLVKEAPKKEFDGVYNTALAKNINLKKILAQEKQSQLGIRLGQNEILPKVDLNVEWNRDNGEGPTRLMGEENRILLSVEVPIEYNRGLGLKRASKAQQEQLIYRSQLEKEKLKTQVQALVTEVNTFADVYKVTRDEVEFSRLLSKAEYRKFSQGASDLILVNLREETYAEAQIRNLETLLNYKLSDAEIKNISVEFITR